MSEQVPKRPYSNVNTALQDMLGQLFGLIPGLGPMLSQMLSPMVANYLAPYDSMINQYIWGGNGPRSAAFAYMNTLQNRSWSAGASAIDDAAAYRVHMAYAKTMNPNADDTQLRNLVANSMSNSFSVPSIIQMLLDPYKVSQGTAMARTVASSLQNRGAGFNISGAEYAAQINSTLFGGTDMYDRTGKGEIKGILNEILEDPSQYGNMNMADVMAVARELSTTRNYSKSSGRGMEFDSKQFKTDVQNLSKALEPWKEIFGKDIPQLMGQLEALTGRSVGAQSGSLHNTALNMMSVLNVTGAKIQHIAAYKDAIAPALADPTHTNRSVLGAHNVATDMVLGLSNISVNSLTTQELQQLGGVFYTGTAKSQFADSFALAYAAWAEGQKGKDKNFKDDDKSRQKFYDAYKQALSGGLSHQAALESVVGGVRIQDLEHYRYTDSYLNMAESGVGGKASRDTALSNAERSTRGYIDDNAIKLGNTNLSDFLGMSITEKAAVLMENNQSLKSNRDAAIKMATDISKNFARNFRSTTGLGIEYEDVRALQATANNERRQRVLAEQHKKFLDIAGKMSSVGGLQGVIQHLYDDKGNAGIMEAIKAYAGGSDYARIALETMVEEYGVNNIKELTTLGPKPGENAKPGELEAWQKKKDLLTKYTRAQNFISNNFAELATTYKPITDVLLNKNSSQAAKQKAFDQFALLSQIDRKALAGMDKEDRDKLANYVVDLTADDNRMDEAEKLRQLKDHVLDSGFRSLKTRITSADSNNTELREYMGKIENWMEGDTSASKEELIKNWETYWKKQNANKYGVTDGDWSKAEARDAWAAEQKKFKGIIDKLGDIDKVDPMVKIAKVIEDILTVLGTIATNTKK